MKVETDETTSPYPLCTSGSGDKIRCHGWESESDLYQQKPAHERINGSQHRRKTTVSCDEMRNTAKQITQESHGMNEKVVLQKMASSSILKERQVGTHEQMNETYRSAQVS